MKISLAKAQRRKENPFRNAAALCAFAGEIFFVAQFCRSKILLEMLASSRGRRPRALSLSKMPTAAVAGLPRLAFDTLLNMRWNVSLVSNKLSLIMATLKFFDDSPGAKVSIPDIATKSLSLEALPF
jgi:hypothetical protein